MQSLASSTSSTHASHSRAVASGLQPEPPLAHQHRRLRAVRAGAPAHSLPGATCCPLRRELQRLQPCRAAAKDTKDTGGPPGRSSRSRPPCSSACGRHCAMPLLAPSCHKLAGVAGLAHLLAPLFWRRSMSCRILRHSHLQRCRNSKEGHCAPTHALLNVSLLA